MRHSKALHLLTASVPQVKHETIHKNASGKFPASALKLSSLFHPIESRKNTPHRLRSSTCLETYRSEFSTLQGTGRSTIASAEVNAVIQSCHLTSACSKYMDPCGFTAPPEQCAREKKHLPAIGKAVSLDVPSVPSSSFLAALSLPYLPRLELS